MTDAAFIEQILKEGARAREKAVHAFSNLPAQQLNWKPSQEKWSIAQCLDHLIISDSSYFPDLQKIAQGKYEMRFWEKYSPLTGFFGKMMKNQLQEQVKRKMVAPDVFKPALYSDKPVNFVAFYLKNLDTLLTHIANCKNADLDKTVISSPVTGFITYNLRDAFQFLMQHEHRHLNQALAVKEEVGFGR